MCKKDAENSIMKQIKVAFDKNSDYYGHLEEIKVLYRKIKKRDGEFTLINNNPGYIYLKLNLNSEIIKKIEKIDGVFRFVRLAAISNESNWPVPLTRGEVRKITSEEQLFTKEEAFFDIKLKIGELVTIKKHNFFKGQTAEVISINKKTGKIWLEVSFLTKKYKIFCNYHNVQKK